MPYVASTATSSANNSEAEADSSAKFKVWQDINIKILL